MKRIKVGYKTRENNFQRELQLLSVIKKAPNSPRKAVALMMQRRIVSLSGRVFKNKKSLDEDKVKYRELTMFNIEQQEKEIKNLKQGFKNLKNLNIDNLTSKEISILSQVYSMQLHEKYNVIKEYADSTFEANIFKALNMDLSNPLEILNVLNGFSLEEIYDKYVALGGDEEDFYYEVKYNKITFLQDIMAGKIITENNIRTPIEVPDELIKM